MKVHPEIEYQVPWQVVQAILRRSPVQSYSDAVLLTLRLMAYADNAITQDTQRLRAYQAKTFLIFEAQKHQRDEEVLAVFRTVMAALDLMVGNTVTHPLDNIPLPSREEKKEALTRLKANDSQLFYEIMNYLVVFPSSSGAEKINFLELMREI